MASNNLMTLTNTLAQRLGIAGGDDLLDTLKATVFKGNVTDAQMVALMIVSNQYGLNPWTKEIYAYPDKQNGIVPVVGVDGWVRIINTHPQFDGMQFENGDGFCTCSIFRKDRSRPVVITEYFDECFRPAFKSKDGYEIKGPWQSHPRRMLRHKAMIQCARIAFGFGGIYDEDEAERITERFMGDAVVVSQTEAKEVDLDEISETISSLGKAQLMPFWTKIKGEIADENMQKTVYELVLERRKQLSSSDNETGANSDDKQTA